MSKLKRKWLRVIEYEETGNPLDQNTRNSLLETHPDLPVLHDAGTLTDGVMPEQDIMEHHYPMPPPAPMMSTQQMMMAPPPYPNHSHGIPIEPQIDSQLEQQIQQAIASADVPGL